VASELGPRYTKHLGANNRAQSHRGERESDAVDYYYSTYKIMAEETAAAEAAGATEEDGNDGGRDEKVDSGAAEGGTATEMTSSVVPVPVPVPVPTSSSKRKIVRRKRIRRKQRGDDDKDKGDDTTPSLDRTLLEKALKEACLPAAYQFEIEKTCKRILSLQAKHVALQMPEGLLMYATVIGDILQRVVGAALAKAEAAASAKATASSAATDNVSEIEQQQEVANVNVNAITKLQVSVLGDVTYGACCVDDLTARGLGADLLVHYGHSCLVPLQHTVVPCLYVFVEIDFNVSHMVESLHVTLLSLARPQGKDRVTEDDDEQDQGKGSSSSSHTIFVLGTVQFRHTFGEAKEMLEDLGYDSVRIPQVKPLSPGEVLGCTTPKLDVEDGRLSVVCFVADGRFHLESTMIANPHIDAFYRYDPYSRTLTLERYDHEQMHRLRKTAVDRAAASSARTFGIILGTLGRQGNPAIVRRIRETLSRHNKRHFVMLLSEITPAKLELFDAIEDDDDDDEDSVVVDAWVQVACPRLSVDWGHYLSKKPVLTPYELFVCLEETEWENRYPMDYYSLTGGPWSNYYEDNKDRQYVVPSTTTAKV